MGDTDVPHSWLYDERLMASSISLYQECETLGRGSTKGHNDGASVSSLSWQRVWLSRLPRWNGLFAEPLLPYRSADVRTGQRA